MVIDSAVRLYVPVKEPVGSLPVVQAGEYRDRDALDQITTWVTQLRARGTIGAGVRLSIKTLHGEAVGFLDDDSQAADLLGLRCFLVLSGGRLSVVDQDTFLRDHRDLNDMSGLVGVPSPAGGPIDLSQNQMASLPSVAVVNAIVDAAIQVNRSPSDDAVLIGSLADRVGVDATRLAVGSGSTGVREQIVTAFRADHGPVEILTATPPSATHDPQAAPAGPSNIRTRSVPLVGDRVDLPGLLDAITDDTQIVFVSNPNNVTGTVLRTAELAAFLDRVPERVLVVVDETYREFVTDPDVADGVALADGRPNVAVLRNSVTALALAGLRVGYLVAAPAVAATVRAAAAATSRINQLGEAAAVAAMSTVAPARAYCADVIDERTRVRNTLRAAGHKVPLSEANFLWLPLGRDTTRFVTHCAERHVVVRPFPELGVRVTVSRRPAENDAALDAALAFGGPR